MTVRHLGSQARGGLLQRRLGKVARLRVEGADHFDGDLEGAHGTDVRPEFVKNAVDDLIKRALSDE